MISRKALKEFWERHADAEVSLRAWHKIAEQGSFGNLAELKQTFASVDYAPPAFHVFNIGGNNYRLVTAIHFNAQRIFIRHVLTHAEYDKGDWKK